MTFSWPISGFSWLKISWPTSGFLWLKKLTPSYDFWKLSSKLDHTLQAYIGRGIQTSDCGTAPFKLLSQGNIVCKITSSITMDQVNNLHVKLYPSENSCKSNYIYKMWVKPWSKILFQIFEPSWYIPRRHKQMKAKYNIE